MLTIALLNVLLLKEIIGRNLMLGQKAFCRTLQLKNIVTDGDYSMSKNEVLARTCSLLQLALTESYLIHYVSVFEGNRPPRINNTGNWNFYIATLVTARSEMNICGYFNRIASPPTANKGHQINCRGDGGVYHRQIEFSIERGYGLSITEIEVVSLGMLRLIVEWLVFSLIRCVSHFNPRKTDVGHSIETCGSFCSQHAYAALQGTVCHCGSSEFPSNEIELRRCYYKCAYNPNYFCGGKVGYSVYLVNIQIPYVHGCYKANLKCTKADCFENLKMTVARCLKFCKTKRFAALGLGFRCICSGVVPKGNHDRDKCKTPCGGDKAEMCGGNEYHTFYGTCISEKLSTSCDNMLYCKTDIDQFGMCTTACLTGFILPLCIERDLSKVIFDYTTPASKSTTATSSTATSASETTTANESTTITTSPGQTTTHTTSTISSTPSTTVTNTTTPSTPVATTTTPTIRTTSKVIERTKRFVEADACNTNPCKEFPNSACVIFGEIYSCECITGFTKKGTDSKIVCEDVDECMSSPCDDETSECHNIFGAFECDCKDGFIMNYEDVCTKNISSSHGEDPYEFTYTLFYAICALVILTISVVFYYDTVMDADESSE